MSLLSLLLTAAAAVAAAGPADLSAYAKGQRVGAYAVESLYLDPAGAPKGARFRHERGFSVDVLFFASVPQVSLTFRSLPDDERGAPHALEHLVLGKGRTGRLMNTLMPLRMGDYSALTYSDVTLYQFSTAAGPREFYELQEVFLRALARPEYSDEEIRRETAHFAVAASSAGRRVEEKGTVYNEMSSRMENPDSVLWDELNRRLYGRAHPLALNQGGAPDALWELTPARVRDFHAAHYRLDANLSLIAALPMEWTTAEYLDELDALVRRIEPRASTRPADGLPPFASASGREPWIGRYPSEDVEAPRSALFVWPPVKTFTREESLRLGLALNVLADGDSAYLHRDLVDRKTRKPGADVTGVGSYSEDYPASYVMIGVSGLPAPSVDARTLERLRALVRERVRWLHDLKPGASELVEIAEKARALILTGRRSALKSMDGPPGFGQRMNGAGWHRYLDRLQLDPGFAKPMDAGAFYDRLEAELAAGANPWAAALARAGLLEEPYAAAVKADPALLAAQRAAREQRLAVETARLTREAGTDEAAALAAFAARYDAATAALEGKDGGVAPAFLKEPPLELDSLDWSSGTLPSGVPLIRTHFPTPFTDLRVSFDAGAVDAEDYELLPLLAESLTGVGVVIGTVTLDYGQVEERLRAEVYGAGAGLGADPATRRARLTFSAGASSPDEIRRAAAWLETFMRRSALGPASRERLIDMVRQRQQGIRAMFQQDEEQWVGRAAAAYEHQDQPLYMALHSPFTSLRHLDRLRWRLEEPAPEQRAVIVSTLAATRGFAARGERKAAADFLAGVPGELGEQLRWELSHLPEQGWGADLNAVCDGVEADLGRSAETISRLAELGRSLQGRAGARVRLNGSHANVELAARELDRLLAALPPGQPPRPTPLSEGLVTARLRRRLPGRARATHVALVNPGGKAAAVSVSVPAPGFAARSREELLDVLALGTLAGGGAHSLFMRTWAAGLAYSNGLSHNAYRGRASYYAERCPDPARTLAFSAEVASAAKADKGLLEYSLSGAFQDYRAGGDFSSRGGSMAADLEDGRAPALVRDYKRALLRLARDPAAIGLVDARLRKTLGRVLIGLPGGRVAAPGASAFLVAPEGMIGSYEAWLKEKGEADFVARLYPSDFWP